MSVIRNHLSQVVSSGGGPAAQGLAGTSDHVHWTARHPSKNKFYTPADRRPDELLSTYICIYIYMYIYIYVHIYIYIYADVS